VNFKADLASRERHLRIPNSFLRAVFRLEINKNMFFWIYDIPSWQLAAMLAALFVGTTRVGGEPDFGALSEQS
jgi:hypothetical protein